MELWGMQSTPLLQLLPGQLWPWMLAPDRALSTVQIELFERLIGEQTNDLC